MPKQVDRHERRTAIADALLRVAATRGLEAVSVRHVAAEAGVSVGMVQHWFRSKDEMMTFALGVVRDVVQARLESRRAAGDPRSAVRAFFVELLPLDAQRHAEAQVALAFHAHVAVRPHLAESLRRDTAELRTHLGMLVPGGEPVSGALLALVEGLSVHVLVGHCTAEQAEQALDDRLDALFAVGPVTGEGSARPGRAGSAARGR